MSGPNVYEWKQSAENWILSIPAPSALNRTIYEDFEEEFIELWTDANEPYRAAADLDKLRMRHDNVDEYITRFAELARKALYHEDDPAVLEKFKSGLPLELLKPCMHHDSPQNWEAWTRSARVCQAILTSLKAHQADIVTVSGLVRYAVMTWDLGVHLATSPRCLRNLVVTRSRHAYR